MSYLAALLDSDMLSEIMKGRDSQVLHHAREYLEEHRVLRFSLITRYEVLRGLHAKDARRQITAFLVRCQASVVYPITEEIVDRAAEIYGSLWKRGQLISEGDLLIAATAFYRTLSSSPAMRAIFSALRASVLSHWRKGQAGDPRAQGG